MDGILISRFSDFSSRTAKFSSLPKNSWIEKNVNYVWTYFGGGLKLIFVYNSVAPLKIKVRLLPSKTTCFSCFNKRSFKMMKNTFYFTLKVLFILKIFNCFSWFFDHAEKNGLINVITWLTNNYNKHIAQYLKK